VKLGVLLPTFRDNADDALAAAQVALDAGLDGVFAYDHLWPMGTPERPALAPFGVLAAVGTRFDLTVGTLVARMGLASTEHVVEEFKTLEHFAPGRVIAALGTGDKLSAAENIAYGLHLYSADERRALLAATFEALHDTMPVWFGAGESATNELAHELGATLNLWDVTPDEVAREVAKGPSNWAGPAPSDVGIHLDALERAGSSWAVFSPQTDVAALKEWRDTREKTRFH
jgi:alkanesulfonate monooxygenase SsuD/methylene tetrahydromethanopterin reductase-like flavin-dependent oxidoreductase (luciferase family)